MFRICPGHAVDIEKMSTSGRFALSVIDSMPSKLPSVSCHLGESSELRRQTWESNQVKIHESILRHCNISHLVSILCCALDL